MKLWTIAGFVTGLIVVSMIAQKCKSKCTFANNPDKRYDIEEFLNDQDL